MVINAAHIITALLVLLNCIGALIWYQISDLKKFLLATRKIVDAHLLDKDAHCDTYKARVLHTART